MKAKTDLSSNPNYHELLKRLNDFDQRLVRLESGPKHQYVHAEDDEFDGLSLNFLGKGNAQLESHIGEYGLAWLGNIVLFFGIIFLVQFLQENGFGILSPIIGFVSVAGIFFLAHFLRFSNTYMANIFNLNAYILAFIVTLKLHYFTSNPIIANQEIGFSLLFIITFISMSIAIRKKYAALTGISFGMITVTAILSDSTHLMLPMASLLAIAGIVILYRFGWIRLLYLAIFMAYLINLIWMFNNPIMGHQLQIIPNHQFGFIYLFLIAAIFSLIALMPAREEHYSDVGIVGSVIFNGIGFTFVTTLFIFSFFNDGYVPLTGSIALFCLAYSFILQVKSKWRIMAALYALFGFVTLSVTFYGIYDFPRAYFLLAIQSLLVVSMAIWFRSKFIVVMNSLLFFILLMGYLNSSPIDHWMNISFSIVALATARILNWKKELLTIRTELIRNFYLITAFLMVLYTLYHLISNKYIALSWTLAAVVYFALSILLKNVKYRYLALGSMIAAAFYLFIVDLARIELIYRVLAMLFLALISIGLSFYYTKKLKKKAM